MDALERYYQDYLLGYSQDTNYSIYDMDMQYTKDRIEKILLRGYVAEDEIDFIKSLLPEIESLKLREEIREYLDMIS